MTYRGAIIGFGHIATNGHLPAYRRHSRLNITAVADRLPSAARTCARELPRAIFYEDAARLLEKEKIDFIDIATPPSLHAGLICRGLAAGRHVLCEKPLVLQKSDLERIASLAKNTGKVIFTAHNWRYAPIFQEISRLIDEQAIGNVRQITYTVIRTQPSVTVGEGEVCTNWRLNPEIAGGGILVDHGWHAFYMLNQWAGSAPQQVACRLENRKYTDIAVEDTASITIDYRNLTAKLFFTWAGDRRQNHVAVDGSSGWLHVNDDTLQIENNAGRRQLNFTQALSGGSHHPDWYGRVLDDFLHEIETPALRGRNLEEAAWCLHLLDACRRSHKNGQHEILPAAALQGTRAHGR